MGEAPDEDIEELLAEDGPPTPPALPSEPIDGPEEHELTQTGQDDDEVDTHTYIPTVTELVTDLDATPLSSSLTESTEPLMDSGDQPAPAAIVVVPRIPEPTGPPAPPALPVAPGPGATPEVPRPFDPNAAAAAAGPLGSTPQRGQAARFVGQERDFRGRVIPKEGEEQTRIGTGEKLGVAIAVTFLLLMILALTGYHFLGGSTQVDETAPTQRASTDMGLPGGVAIAEREGAGKIEAEEYLEVGAGDVKEGELTQPEGATKEGALTEASEPTKEPVRAEAEAAVDEAAPAEAEGVTEEATRTVPNQTGDETAPAEQEVAAAKPKPKPKAAAAKPPVALATSEAEVPEIPAQPGLITVSSYPWSEVWINGKRAGDIPLNEHSLPAGVHTIRLVFPTAGNRELTEKIEVRAGKHLKIVRKLDLTTPQPEN